MANLDTLSSPLPKALLKKLIFTLLLLNSVICTGVWFGVDLFIEKRLNKLIEAERKQAEADAQITSEALNRQLSETRSIPIVLAQDPSVQKILGGLGPSVKPSKLTPAERAEAWNKDPVLAALAARFTHIVSTFDLNSVWMTNAAGDTLAEGHAPGVTPFCGTNYADRDYFKAAQAGQNGFQFAVGRVTNKYALFFSSPVQVDGAFVGMIGANFKMEKLTPLVKQVGAFVTDENGVIVLAPDPNLLMHAVPGARVKQLDPHVLERRYKRQTFETIPLRMLQGGAHTGLYSWQQTPGPYLLATHTTEGAPLQVCVLRNLQSHVAATSADRTWWFILLSLSSVLLTALFGGSALYLDVTRRQQHALRDNEQRLLETNRQWNLLTKCGSVLVINYLDEGKIYFSDGIRNLLGYDEAELDNWLTVDQWHRHLDPDEIDYIHNVLLPSISETATTAVFEHRVRHKDGSWRWVLFNGSVIRREADNRTRITGGTLTDITSIKQMEAQLKELNENLLQRIEEETGRRIANEGLLTQNAKMAAMGEMIGAIAHQWRQPLATVGVIFQNLLAARKMNKLDEAYLEKAATDATVLINHMSKTIDSFRNFFKPEKKKELFNAVEKIEDATGFIRAQLVSHAIAINLPECRDAASVINGFPNEFAQVILNLLANARDAILDRRQQGGDGADSITVTAQTNDTQIIIEVIDTGCGIPPEHANRLFEPYFTTKEDKNGTGIGLYMSRQIIEESMGGKLTFTSKPGETVFRIELPHA